MEFPTEGISAKPLDPPPRHAQAVDSGTMQAEIHLLAHQKTREGCGCPKFPAGKVLRQIWTLLEDNSPIFRQHKMLSLQGLGTFRQGNRLLENWLHLRKRCWILSSETATAFLSSSACTSLQMPTVVEDLTLRALAYRVHTKGVMQPHASQKGS